MLSDWKSYPVPVGAVIVLASAYVWFDTKYVQAADFSAQIELTQQTIQLQNIQIDELRLQQLIAQRNDLQDSLFDLKFRLRGTTEIHPDDEKRLLSLEQAILDLELEIGTLRVANSLSGDSE